MDIMSPTERSKRMRSIRSANTGPEMLVRRLVHRMGYRYRLHVKNLPGKPDLVFVAKRKIIFVHGCFWHFHIGCRDGKIPQSRENYWRPKLLKNRERDVENIRSLEAEGWNILVIWECELKDEVQLRVRLHQFLSGA
jgi:DNA mismatch endonuclease, patch repair protein